MAASFVPIPPGCDFPLNNLPYGAYRRRVGSTPPSGSAVVSPRLCVALGEHVVDLAQLQAAGCFSGPILSQHPRVFSQVGGWGWAHVWRHSRGGVSRGGVAWRADNTDQSQPSSFPVKHPHHTPTRAAGDVE
jgi:fumarylacetoacetase